MKKPIIGIAANVIVEEQGFFPGMSRAALSYDYVESVAMAGGVPIMLPMVEEADIEQQIQLLDGLLLSGGFDVDPLKYGEEPVPELGALYPELDEYQMKAAQIAVKLKKPLLGICRGLQVINSAFGGTLYQDITYATSSGLKHFQKSARHLATHTVALTEGTALAEIFGTTEVLTNSYHHQSVKVPAPGFVVNAKARDGVIEGLEKMGESFILGLQWHPEMMAAHSAEMRKVFAAFIAAAK